LEWCGIVGIEDVKSFVKYIFNQLTLTSVYLLRQYLENMYCRLDKFSPYSVLEQWMSVMLFKLRLFCEWL